MISATASFCTWIVAVSLLLTLWRVIFGPTTPDRVVALDATIINVLALIVLAGVLYGTQVYVDAVLVIAVLGFFGTVAMAKYLLGGTLGDPDSR